jgi:hypothetical protein
MSKSRPLDRSGIAGSGPKQAPGSTSHHPLSNVRRASEIKSSFFANYPCVQYHYVQFLTEHLVDCSKSFGGDFDQVIILAVLGQSHINAVVARAQRPKSNSPPIWINASRIADVTGLARETVRRKLGLLADRGWVEQNERRGWQLVGPADGTRARRDLNALDRRAIARLAKLFAALEPLSWPPKMGSSLLENGPESALDEKSHGPRR